MTSTEALSKYLEAGAKLREAATPGPWETDAGNTILGPSKQTGRQEYIRVYLGEFDLSSHSDAEFVVDARTRIEIYEKIIKTLAEALDIANVTFMAMGNSTMDNGAPSSQELILMCEKSAVKAQTALASVSAMLPEGETK